MDIDQLIANLKTQLALLFKNKFTEFGSALQKDVDTFLNNSKATLKRWLLLLSDGSITQDEFEWLLKSQQDLIVLQALQTAGISKIKLNNIKKAIIKTVVETTISGLLKGL